MNSPKKSEKVQTIAQKTCEKVQTAPIMLKMGQYSVLQ